MCSVKYVLLAFIVLWDAVTTRSKDLTWNMKSDVASFGQTVVFECVIPDNLKPCTGSFYQWYGGNSYALLCRDEVCRNGIKYLAKKDSLCKYSLEIRNFSENDVNCEYTCTYGVHEGRKLLKLDDEHFVYVPLLNEVAYSVEVDDLFTVNVSIPKVFPQPSCQAAFADKNLYMAINISSKGDFYATKIRIQYLPPVNMCKGVFEINCMIGHLNFTPINQYVTVCKENSNDQRQSTYSITPMVLVSIGIIVILIMFMTVGIYCSRYRSPLQSYVRYRPNVMDEDLDRTDGQA